MPRRIISLVPSLTELVFSLGAGESLVGRTRFCDEPSELVGRVPVVGGTKNPRIERIQEAAPDLVLANKEENRREDVEALRGMGIEVLLTDPNTVDEAIEMVLQLGDVLERRAAAQRIADETRTALHEDLVVDGVRVLVPVWWNPLMALGSGAYGQDLLERCGAVNVLASRTRYPEISLDEARELRPDVILLPDEPFPFDASHVAGLSSIAPARVIDGKLLWWYGPRMPAAIRALRVILHEVAGA